MNAPIAMLPLPANDRPARPVCFTSRAGAVAHAARLARLASPSGAYHTTEFLTDTFRPVEGGDGYTVRLGVLDWEVVALPAADVERSQQSYLRRLVAEHNERADAERLLANAAKPGSCFERTHLVASKQYRDRARALELRLTVATAPVAEWSDEDRFYRRDVPGAKLEGME